MFVVHEIDETNEINETDKIDEMKQVSCFRTYVPVDKQRSMKSARIQLRPPRFSKVEDWIHGKNES